MSGETVRPRRSRKSIAFQPNASEASKETAAAVPEVPTKRKSRSKSLGPGGLAELNAEESKKDPLKNGSGNRRRESSVTPAPQVKGILMPTLPISPQQIPAFRSKALPPRGAMKQSSHTITSLPPPPQQSAQPAPTIPIRTEEEQQQRADILAARAARRQSLGNRRVSFAPEATLHTWDVHYFGGDNESTPSSTAGGSSRSSTPASNRRSSSGSALEATPTPGAQPDSDPPEPETPVKNRRTPASDDDSSPLSSPDSHDPSFVEQGFSGSDSDDSDFNDGGDEGASFVSHAADTTIGDMTMGMSSPAVDDTTGAFTLGKMQMDDFMDDERTQKPIFRNKMNWTLVGPESSPAGTPARPNAPLAESEDEGDMTMGMDITRPVGGLLSRPQPQEEDEGEMSMDMTRPIGRFVQTPKAQRQQKQDSGDAEMSMDMDVTRPVGGILSRLAQTFGFSKPQPQEQPEEDDGTGMDMTVAIGGILSGPKAQKEDVEEDMDEDMGMDMTVAIGGILSGPKAQKEDVEEDMDEDMGMDMTVAIGGILSGPKSQKQHEEKDMDEDMGMDMDMTRDVGSILSGAKATEKENPVVAVEYPSLEELLASSVPKIDEPVSYPTLPEPDQENIPEKPKEKVMEKIEEKEQEQSDVEDMDMSFSMSSLPAPVPASSPEPTPVTPEPSKEATAVSTPTQSNRRSTRRTPSATATPAEVTPQRITRGKKSPTEETPAKKSSTPKKTPTAKTPAAKKAAATKMETPVKAETPIQTPTKAVTPPPQKKSTPQTSKRMAPPQTPLRGVGIDRPGLGSPAVSAKVSRRKSLSEDTMAFSPIVLPSVVIKACREDTSKREAEEKAAQEQRENEEQNLDIMSRIQLLTPRKPALSFSPSPKVGTLVPGMKRVLEDPPTTDKKRRKSSGAETMDQDPSDDEDFSPIKPYATSVLASPRRSPRKMAPGAPMSPLLKPKMTVPTKTGEEKFQELDESIEEEEIITLPEFLKTINYDTTILQPYGYKIKRTRRSLTSNSGEARLSDRIWAGACAASMLEFYRTFCRDFERHLDESRSAVQQIEEITAKENPLLFREYMRATAEEKEIMKLQFDTVNSNSRHLAKMDYYQSRITNAKGIMETVKSNMEGLLGDEKYIQQQEEVVKTLLPQMEQEWLDAKYQFNKVESLKERINADPASDLEAARVRLAAALEKQASLKSQIEAVIATDNEISAQISTLESTDTKLKQAIENLTHSRENTVV
ncbi:Similar to Kinetochore protein spc7; acc. no. O59757 [Pyronema omphalodes CBS 100304]|uniref:Similar to Kinetochore protein spc7 acc. no. O59757 n=1 Tax=Pyronema omphalodes (strain CBS 100304) TaxID=1076935 RepID=U4LG14_PYROM|nr:Similar to Kinetochore protein spc7; acc. no. O59757 [Pyronema omphalodes CBS 100304]